MGDTTIEWTDAVWNPVTGCTKVSQGCKNCYAERIFKRPYPDREFTDVQCHPERLDQPLRWKKPRRIFVNSMSDLFHEAVPDEFIDQVCAVMATAREHTFQVLTKRPERMLKYFQEPARPDCIYWAAYKFGYLGAMCGGTKAPIPIPNVHLGVSVEDQESADERIPLLLQTPAAVRFISAEPLLTEVDLRLEGRGSGVEGSDTRHSTLHPSLDWVIAGGESGPKARPMHPDLARSLRDQCVAAGVPYFFKQWGEWLPYANCVDRINVCGIKRYEFDDETMFRVGKKAAGAVLDGREWREFPEPWSAVRSQRSDLRSPTSDL